MNIEYSINSASGSYLSQLDTDQSGIGGGDPSDTESTQSTIPSNLSNGTYQICATANYDGLISEINSSNNSICQSITLTNTGSCPSFISPNNASYLFGGGSDWTYINIGNSCPWTATASDPSWIHIQNSSGVGSDYINFSLDQNNSTNPRTGQITIQGSAFVIYQDGQNCISTLPISSANIPWNGGS
ncbi:MAG: BACON domain-containing protein [Bacteroidetes bacterium]|nr:BACON domain-containing protein [Bacteroidota bacterium]